jgi:hypothetical protein
MMPQDLEASTPLMLQLQGEAEPPLAVSKAPLLPGSATPANTAAAAVAAAAATAAASSAALIERAQRRLAEAALLVMYRVPSVAVPAAELVARVSHAAADLLLRSVSALLQDEQGACLFGCQPLSAQLWARSAARALVAAESVLGCVTAASGRQQFAAARQKQQQQQQQQQQPCLSLTGTNATGGHPEPYALEEALSDVALLLLARGTFAAQRDFAAGLVGQLCRLGDALRRTPLSWPSQTTEQQHDDRDIAAAKQSISAAAGAGAGAAMSTSLPEVTEPPSAVAESAAGASPAPPTPPAPPVASSTAAGSSQQHAEAASSPPPQQQQQQPAKQARRFGAAVAGARALMGLHTSGPGASHNGREGDSAAGDDATDIHLPGTTGRHSANPLRVERSSRLDVDGIQAPLRPPHGAVGRVGCPSAVQVSVSLRLRLLLPLLPTVRADREPDQQRNLRHVLSSALPPLLASPLLVASVDQAGISSSGDQPEHLVSAAAAAAAAAQSRAGAWLA